MYLSRTARDARVRADDAQLLVESSPRCVGEELHHMPELRKSDMQ